MGKKNKKGGGGGGAKAGASSSSGHKDSTESGPTLSRSAKREVIELVNQLLEICSRQPSQGAKELEDYPEIHGLVEKIRMIQSGLKPAEVDREQAFSVFMEWLHRNDVDTSAVEIHSFPGYGYGLRATKDVKEAELLLKIPRKVMMTVDSAFKSQIGDIIREDKILHVMPNIALAMHLLTESKTPDSFWKPYIDILPTTYTTPLYYSPEELQYLRGSPTLGNSITQYRSVARQYAYFYKMLHRHPTASKLNINDNFTFDEYRWAVSAVMTRQNLIPKEGSADKKTYGLIPLLDMCNHAGDQFTTDFDIENDCSVCYSQDDVAAGDQIFMFYGPRSNGEFLVHNGFIALDNEHDRLCIKLGISKGDPLFEAKTELLRKIYLQMSRFFFLHSGECPVDGELVAFLRIFSMDEDTLKSKYPEDCSDETVQKLTDLESPVSLDNEEKVWSFLETRAALLLKAYPTTVEDDENQLKESDLPDTLVTALELRVREKKILQNTISFAARQKQELLHSVTET